MKKVTEDRWNWKYIGVFVFFFIFVFLVGVLKLYYLPSLSDRESTSIETNDISAK